MTGLIYSNVIHLAHILHGKQLQWVKNFINGKTFLEKRYSEDLELDDAVHTAILTLKEGFEGQMTADNIEVGICDVNGFRKLDPSNVKDYLANIP